jgi:methyl-accepting chemotaxis protein
VRASRSAAPTPPRRSRASSGIRSKSPGGTRLVEQAGSTIEALVVDVKQVSDLMRAIADASAEQSRGVQQVNKTVTEMDKVVQQNA